MSTRINETIGLVFDEFGDGSRVVTNTSKHLLTVVRADGDRQPFYPGHTVFLGPGDSLEGKQNERASDG